MNLESFESVKRWLTYLDVEKSGSESTHRVYLHYFKEFCKFAGMHPDQLISMRTTDLKSDDMAVRRRHEEMLQRFFLHLEKDRGLKRNTCSLAFNAVKSFYKANYANLNVRGASTWAEKRSRRLSQQEVKALVDVVHLPMHKAFILCQAQSGLSVSDLLKLTYGEVKEQLDVGSTRIHLENRREKTKAAGYHDTFFGKEAVSALREYVAQATFRDSDRLFPCTARNINIMLERASRRAGIDPISSHNLRKFFDSHMKLDVKDAVLVDWWMGHNVGKIKATYSIPPWERQLEEFVEGEPQITIFQEGERGLGKN